MKNLSTKISIISLIVFSIQFATLSLPTITKANSESFIAAQSTGNNVDCNNPTDKNDNACKIIGLINSAINILSGLASISIAIAIIIAGIQYSTAGANPQAASAAKNRINQALIALIVLILMYPFLQWIIPGGVF